MRKGRKRVTRRRKERKREKGRRKMIGKVTQNRVTRRWWAKWMAMALGPSSFL